ncbi:RING finger protein 151-like [Dermacentor silvarum]|uniref:RING finger protein 151-like n=1 Tax=Dermacentor silvarum TaxID=543639 RepID=UPI002100EACC|nr:RING finger protein 151-like [Dermacentor silvarum]
MTDATYTLTGFGVFLERRRLTFVEPLPAIRVCSICGLVPSSTQLLPCCHVVCDGPCGRQVKAAGSCPLDGRTVTTSSDVHFKFEQSELEQLLVRCLNGTDICTFVGKLSELVEHLFACECDAVECSKRGGRVC